jgi:hypothetical protein
MSHAKYIPLLAISTLLAAVSSANALPLAGLSQADKASANSAIIKVHGVHPGCMWGPVSPNGTGPAKYHRTPEAGVHILCKVPPRPGASGLTIKPRHQVKSGASKLMLR